MALGKCLLLRHLCMFHFRKGVREVILRRGSQSESASGNPARRSEKANAKTAHLGRLDRDRKFSTCRHPRDYENTPCPIGPSACVWFGVRLNPIREGGGGVAATPFSVSQHNSPRSGASIEPVVEVLVSCPVPTKCKGVLPLGVLSALFLPGCYLLMRPAHEQVHWFDVDGIGCFLRDPPCTHEAQVDESRNPLPCIPCKAVPRDDMLDPPHGISHRPR